MAIRKPKVKTPTLSCEPKEPITITEEDILRQERTIGTETKRNKMASIATQNEVSDKVLSD